MRVYLNYKTNQGTETVDKFQREANQSPNEFRKYVSQMISEYILAGMNVYKSSRCTKGWNRA